LFDASGVAPPAPEHIRLDSLGNNRNGLPIRALAIDTQFLCPPYGATFGITTSTHHQQLVVNILSADGHASTQRNNDGRFTFNFGTNINVFTSFSTILGLLEKADAGQ
jgi:hypothetical protein